MLLRFFAFLSLGLCIAGASLAATPDAPILRKGISLSSWLANAPRQPLFERDFVQIEAAGFDHVRLPVNPEQFGFTLEPASRGLAEVNFHAIDAAIEMAEEHHLTVVLDIHPTQAFVKTLEEEPWAEDEYIALWVWLAKRYQHYAPNKLVFGLLNEPQYYGFAQHRYAEFSRRLVAAVRRVDSTRYMVVDAPLSASIEGLQKMEPLNDSRIIYGFHFYEPYIITHQGIHDGFEKKMIRYFHDVPYPARLVDKDASFYADGASSPTQAQDELNKYIYEGWNAEHIMKRIALAKQWADVHKVRVICGEFGAFRNHITPSSRYRWIGDVRTALEANHIGWELWDYTDVFGITELVGETTISGKENVVRLRYPEKGSRVIEPEARKALGLNP